MSRPSRRTVLRGLAGTGALGLAGCGSGSAGTPTPAALAKLAELPVGSAKRVKDRSAWVALTRTGQQTVVALSARCTHQGCIVAAKGRELVCPCHGSRFDAITGKVLTGPANRPLPAVPIRVVGGEVLPG